MNAQDLEDLWDLLNSTDPQKSLEEFLLIKKWSKRRKEKFKHRFREILYKAQQEQIPMGVELKNCRNYEDAYLLRQRFLNKFFKQDDNFRTISALMILVILGLTFTILVLLFT